MHACNHWALDRPDQCPGQPQQLPQSALFAISCVVPNTSHSETYNIVRFRKVHFLLLHRSKHHLESV